MKAAALKVGDRVRPSVQSAHGDTQGVIVRKVHDRKGTFYVVKWEHHHALTIVGPRDLRAI